MPTECGFSIPLLVTLLTLAFTVGVVIGGLMMSVVIDAGMAEIDTMMKGLTRGGK